MDASDASSDRPRVGSARVGGDAAWAAVMPRRVATNELAGTPAGEPSADVARTCAGERAKPLALL